MIISPQAAIQLPLHDAHIFRVDVTLMENGYLKALVEVEVNPDESLEPFREFGIKSSKVTLVFQDCWQVASNLFGFATGREVISTFDIIEPSELKQKLRSFNLGSATMVHFRIQDSTGSQLDFVAETFSCYERD